MKSFVTLLKNELKLNIRNMNMVIFAVIIPLVVLIILGFIYGTNGNTTKRPKGLLQKTVCGSIRIQRTKNFKAF